MTGKHFTSFLLMKKFYYLTILALLPFLKGMNAQSVIYVSAAATGNNSGTSWANAFSDLHTALNGAEAGDSVWVAQGIYKPDSGTDRTVHFTHKSGVKLFGGFSGTEQYIHERDWTVHPTILSGDIGILGDSTDNSYTVLFMPYPEVGTELDGFIIEKGLANKNINTFPGIAGAGLGILGDSSSAYFVIRNCKFSHNTAVAGGGGVYATTLGLESVGTISPEFINCIFEHNSASNGGAVGIAGRSDSTLHLKEFLNCTFHNNYAVNEAGAGIYFQVLNCDRLEIEDCTFTGNIAKRFGAGAYIASTSISNSDVRILRCTFDKNVAQIGTGVYIRDDAAKFKSIVIDSCTFENNECVSEFPNANVYGSGILLNISEHGSDIKVCHSLFKNNGGFFPVGIYNWDQNTTTFSGNTIDGDLLGSEISSSDSLIFSNNIIRNSSRLVNLLYLQNSRKVLISQNVFYNNFITPRLSFYSGVYEGNVFANNVFANDLPFSPLDTAMIFSNNIFWNNKNTGAPTPGITWKLPIPNLKSKFYNNIFDFEESAVLPATWSLEGGNLFNTEPLFVDTLNGNFHIQSCSPAVNAGTSQWSSLYGVVRDFDGQNRIMNGIQDIGPFEVHTLQMAGPVHITPACAGTGNGSFAFDLINGCLPYSYLWSSNDLSGNDLSNLFAGNYTVTVTDQSGAVLVLPGLVIPVAVPPVISPSITDASCSTCSDGSIVLETAGGEPLTGLEWNTGDTTPGLQQLLPGTSSLTITDGAGCTYVSSYEVNISVGTTELREQDIKIWPNPAAGYFYWRNTSGTALSLQIFDIHGKKQKETMADGKIMIEDFGPGLYFIVLTDTEGRIKGTKRLVVLGK